MNNEKYILFVDDEENVLNSLYRSLYKWLGGLNLKILKSSTAHETIEILREKGNQIAVLVADQKMPHIKGSELSRVVTKKYPDTALIILSGHSDLEEMKDIVKSDVISFVSKPWETENLQKEIQRGLTIFNLRRENRLNRINEEKELRMGFEFQNSILKVSLPEDDRISFKVSSKPFSKTGVGGDYYDIITLDDSRMIILTGDVSGHGLKTSFLGAVLKIIIYPDYIKNCENSTFSPAHFSEWLNRRLCDFLKDFPEMFIAFSTTLVDFSTNTLILANAGQPPVYLLRGEESVRLDQKQLVLGFESDFTYSEIKKTLQAGDRLIFVSDGIYPSGTDSADYSEKDFADILLNHGSRIHNHASILKDIKKAIAPERIEDDITLITAELL